jgi:formamidopyrimidine-DNA glycosylase
LYQALQRILRQAIALGGSTISDFANSDGEPGEFQLNHQAYDREGRNCRRCGKTIRRAIVAGRSSYFCPGCQGTVKGTRIIKLKKVKRTVTRERKSSSTK